MAKKPAKTPGRGWLTKFEAAAAFGVSEVYFDREFRKLAPPDSVKEVNKKLYFRFRDLIDALVASKVEKERDAKAADGDDGPLMIGAETPWMERLREENTLIRRMERRKMEGTLVPRETLDPAIDRLAIVYRRMGETLQRRFGNEASDIVNEAVEEVAAQWERMFGNGGGDRQQPDPDGATADGRPAADPAPAITT